MREVKGVLRIAASDLSTFLACRYATHQDAAVARRELAKPRYAAIGKDALAERGERHEERVRQRFIDRGWRLRSIEVDFERPGDSAQATSEAIAEGVDVIDQGVFLIGDRYGRPDFLIRADLLRPGAIGYEVVDAKLARSAKARAVLQIAFYSRLLASVQGAEPEYMHLALGGQDDLMSLRIAAYGAYERQVDRMLAEFLAAEGPIEPSELYPDPVEHCAVCRWRWSCRDRRRADDDLSLIAGISSRQRKALKAAGIATRRGFAALAAPPQLERVSAVSLSRVHEQAKLQVEGEDAGEMRHRLLPPERDEEAELVPDRGLLALPEPSTGDLYFDIEGARYYSEDDKEFGLQYLFGFVDGSDVDEDGQPRYQGFWASDRASEKRAFEDAIDFIVERLERCPDLHVYHYNHYEPTAMDHLSELHETREAVVGRLMGRFATREAQVDRLLTDRVFVDLYRVIRQGVQASVESYSIKRLEPLYGFERDVELDDANTNLVRFEAALEDGDAEGEPEVREAVRGYNEDDCRSTLELHRWLEARRAELETQLGDELARPQPPENVAEEDVSELQRLHAALMAGYPEDGSEPTEQQAVRKLVADLLEWHRRDDRPKWWRWFHLLRLTDEQLVLERDAIGELAYEGVVGEEGRSNILRFRFPPQDHPFESGDTGHDTSDSGWTIWAVDDRLGVLTLKRAKTYEGLMPTSLIERKILQTDQHRARLRELGERVLALGDSTWPHDPTLDLLLRRVPNVASAPLRRPDEEASEAGRRLAGELDHGFLAIQGPPGTGKTYTGAQQILAVVEGGGRVGVTASSHAVICTLLDETWRVARACGFEGLRIGQKAGDRHVAEGALVGDHVYKDNAEALADLQAGEINVLGGTTWLWAREEFASTVDLLIVDEASQVSLADVLAVCHATRSLVLLGDPQQLGQPTQAAHPPGADASGLDHTLGEFRTMPDDRGLFMERTRRMHPDVCRFTSETFYEGRLTPLEGLENQAVLGGDAFGGAGLRVSPVIHTGNGSSSPEEAAEVVRLVQLLLGRRWVDAARVEHPIDAEQVLIITPFNAQIAEIDLAFESAGIVSVTVGTVDKLQGKQAAVVIYSMASSSVEDAPRGMEFLFDLRRLNVATSRAKAMAILVASPDLVRVMCKTPRQMELANALCRFSELARMG